MGVMCQILINKSRTGVHRPGQKVTGIVKYAVDEPTEYKDVKLSFLGKGVCHWTEKSKDKTRHYTGTENYIVNHIELHKKADEIITLHGEYQYPFEFLLPENIPSSFKDYTCQITYIIELKLIKAKFFSFNKVFTTEIPVRGFVTPEGEGPVIFGLDKKFFSLFTKTPIVNLKAEVDKSWLMPGDNVQITYNVNNNTDVKINSVKTELYCYKTYTADCGSKNVTFEKVKTCDVETTSIGERSTFEHSCILPTLPELYAIDNSKVIDLEYRIKVTVKLPMPHINAVVELPISIGEKRENFETALDAAEDGDEPPSYWEVMSEQKEEETPEK